MKTITFFISALFLLCSILSIADEVVIPVGQQGGNRDSLVTPAKGLTMEAVEKGFGVPLAKSTPIGTPSISNWEYENYLVYFESDRVIHTVVKPLSESSPDEKSTPATE